MSTRSDDAPRPRPRSTTQTRAERTILVYGATGTLGGLVARALGERGAGVVIAGRDADRVGALGRELGCPSRVAAEDDRAALAAAVAGARVVVDCAGPFAGRSTALVEAAIAAGAAYLDVASEPAFLREVYERCESAARKAGVACVSGAGVAPALGDLAAAWAAAAAIGEDDDEGVVRTALPARLAEGAPLDEIAITWVLDGVAAAPGAQRAGIAMLTHGGAV
ncbi:MAG: saccharopine dehydrogenase NADP-binding domain-containing protein, partial [Deltaproteobacteria bacterium]|nr:saccharopine dehydrogenase NADP-binding domain-containing protein [Deltaproteobacteria bacterium]